MGLLRWRDSDCLRYYGCGGAAVMSEAGVIAAAMFVGALMIVGLIGVISLYGQDQEWW